MATLVRHSIEEDFAAWAQETAELLEQRRFEELDLADLIEEVRELARAQYRRLDSQLLRLFSHLLKWTCQAEKRSRSWEISIFDARDKIETAFKDSPSLRSRLSAEDIPSIWKRARKRTALETGLALETIPNACPWDLDTEVLNTDWLP
ncbi:MAG: DUF29 domain-containing protein [Bryobacteraceae bacterium]